MVVVTAGAAAAAAVGDEVDAGEVGAADGDTDPMGEEDEEGEEAAAEVGAAVVAGGKGLLSFKADGEDDVTAAAAAVVGGLFSSSSSSSPQPKSSSSSCSNALNRGSSGCGTFLAAISCAPVPLLAAVPPGDERTSVKLSCCMWDSAADVSCLMTLTNSPRSRRVTSMAESRSDWATEMTSSVWCVCRERENGKGKTTW